MAKCKATIRVKAFVVAVDDVEATTEEELRDYVQDELEDGYFDDRFCSNAEIAELDEIELDKVDEDEVEEDEVVDEKDD